MCGIAGILHAPGLYPRDEAAGAVRRMSQALAHRGPDDSDIWVETESGVCFGHRRLSIVDLSPTGHQPMHSASGRLVIVYNGEVYNHQELREELAAAGHRFRGTSDTEVIVEACERWGIEAGVRRLIGMFAIALWDRRQRTLHLVRDRLGIKPLYWGEFGGTMLFASEVKALVAHPAFRGEIDRAALVSYIRHNYVPAPGSIYRGVRKQRPGSILTFAGGAAPTESIFWCMEDVVRQGLSVRGTACTDGEAEDRLDALLRDAVARHMVADVGLGAFLSGGIDSSTVASLMQAQSTRPVRTFTIGFADKSHDEAAYAKAVASHLGTDHTELYVEPHDAFAVIPRLPDIYDEPFADPSQIPTYLIAALTRRHVTVALSGDGGDELFAGYDRYAEVSARWQWVGAVPWSVRRTAGRILGSVPSGWWDTVGHHSARVRGLLKVVDHLHRVPGSMSNGFNAFYRQSVSYWPHPADVVLGVPGREPPLSQPWIDQLSEDPADQMQYLDSVTYLPDDILTKVDRATMAVSLEARVPLIDHRVVEFAWTLPSKFRVRNGQSKWLLRQVLKRYVPDRLIDRPKMGFGIPLASWLRGPLRGWAEDLLSEDLLRRQQYFRPDPIRRKWAEHLSGACNWQDQLWGVLMFQAWLNARLRAPASHS